MKELLYHRLLLPAVERHGDREVILDGEHRGTLAEHLDRTTRLASALRTELGIGPGATSCSPTTSTPSARPPASRRWC